MQKSRLPTKVLRKVSSGIRKNMEFIFVEDVEEVFEAAFVAPAPGSTSKRHSNGGKSVAQTAVIHASHR